MGDLAKERIRTQVDTTDGFRIAKMDLKLRGPGEFFDTKQSGCLRCGWRTFCAIRKFWKWRA
jgi:RecG-like helicase